METRWIGPCIEERDLRDEKKDITMVGVDTAPYGGRERQWKDEGGTKREELVTEDKE